MTPTPAIAQQIDELAERVDRAVAEVQELDEPARAQALELKDAIEAFHRDGLIQMVRHLKADPRGKELLLELAGNLSVYTLFAMHGIVRTESADAAPDVSPSPKSSNGFVPLGDLRMAPGWRIGPLLAELTEAKPFRFDCDQMSVLLLLLDGAVHAFHNQCAHQGLPLDGGMVDREACTIACPWHGYRYDAVTGECLTGPHVRLQPIEIKVEQGRVHVKRA